MLFSFITFCETTSREIYENRRALIKICMLFLGYQLLGPKE